jgi:cytoskeletal protein CcmA (bactofilin family)
MATTPAQTQIIRCYNCQGMMRVAAKALSVFCPHCHKRVTVESLRVSGSHPSKLLATCGDITVEAGARLNLDLIGDNVEVLGRLNGSIRATGTVELGSTALVVGNIECANVIVRDGGVIRGRCKLAQRRAVAKAAQPTVVAPAAPVHAPDTSKAAAAINESAASPAIRPRQLMPPKPVQVEESGPVSSKS